MSANSKTAKILNRGGRQTVQLPKGVSINSKEVFIKVIGDALILIPKDNPWQTLLESLDEFSDDFMERREQTKIDKRDIVFE